MNNLAKRSITGSLFVVAVVGAILWHPYAFAALFLAVALGCVFEFYALVERGEAQPQFYTGFILGAVFYVASMPEIMRVLLDADDAVLWIFDYWNLLLCLPVLLFVTLIIELFRKTPRPVTNMAHTVFGLVYAVLPFCLLANLIGSGSSTVNPQHFVLAFFLLVWANDTGAYVVGSLVGRTKFFERVSPKKTWEGTLGGAAIALGAAWAISLWLTGLSPAQWLAIGAICAVFATLGDLVQSRIKRSYGVKDTGNILPGHGGLLDRFDGVLLAAPFFYAFARLFLKV